MRGSLVVIALALARPVFAQAPTSESDRLFAEGRAHLTDGKAAEACASFGQAIRLDPVASGTMLNLGLCNEVLGKLKTALYWFRRAQIRATENKEYDLEQVARERTIRLATKVSTLVIELANPTVDAQISVDGERIQPTDYRRVEVDPGPHVLDASAPGRRTVHQAFTITDERALPLRVELELMPQQPDAAPRRPERYLVLAGAALWVTGAGLVAYEKYAVYDPAAERYAQTRDPEDRRRANTAQNVADYAGTAMFAVGAVAIGVGGYLWWTRDRRESAVSIVPHVTGGATGIGLVGTFR